MLHEVKWLVRFRCGFRNIKLSLLFIFYEETALNKTDEIIGFTMQLGYHTTGFVTCLQKTCQQAVNMINRPKSLTCNNFAQVVCFLNEGSRSFLFEQQKCQILKS